MKTIRYFILIDLSHDSSGGRGFLYLLEYSYIYFLSDAEREREREKERERAVLSLSPQQTYRQN